MNLNALLLLWTIALYFSPCQSSKIAATTTTYSLSYEGVVSEEIAKPYLSAEQSDAPAPDSIPVPYDMVTDVATELATDIIQLYAITRTADGKLTPDDRNIDMDRRCYQSIMGGGRCSIDHYRPGEVAIQISIQFDHQQGQEQEQEAENGSLETGSIGGIVAKVDVALSTSTGVARDVLVRSIPMINRQLKCFQNMLWSIREKPTPTVMKREWEATSTTMAKHQQQSDARQASLEHLILERHDLNNRMRIASTQSKSKPRSQSQQEVWQYSTPESKHGVRSLFIDGFLQSTTHPCGNAHAEALVHPGLLSVSSDDEEPPRVAILSLEPTAIVREVLKHKRVQSITLLGVDEEAVKLVQKYLHTLNDCSFLQGREDKGCLAQPEVKVVTGDVDEWLTAEVGVVEASAGTDDAAKHSFHAFFVDVPISGSSSVVEWMDLGLHSKIAALLHSDSVAVVSSGSAPMLSDSYDQSKELSVRDVFLRQATRSKELNGLDYYQAFVYDEDLAKPLASSFITLFPNDSGVITTYFQTNSPAIEIAIVKQLYPMAMGGPPTLVYDGATHASYHSPSRAWQNWYCGTSPGKDLYVCESFLNDWYDPEKHHYRTEVRKDAVKGRSLYALETIPAGHFVMPDDAAMTLRIDAQRWSLLNEFIDRFPDADMYRQIRDFFDAYGFESTSLGQKGWAVSVGNDATFVNHGCTEEERNVIYVEEVYSGEDDGEVMFSPILLRFGELVSVLIHSFRDIAAEEEIQMDYADCEDIEGGDSELTRMCNTGVGAVDPIDGRSLLGNEGAKDGSDKFMDEAKSDL